MTDTDDKQQQQVDLADGNEDAEDTSTSYDYLIKLLLLGDSGVGKTCFLHRYTDGEFKPNFIATVGVDFRLKKLNYEFPEADEGDVLKKVHLQLWDTAGQERYRSLTKAFFRDGMGFLLLFDLTHENSFQSVRQWLNEIKEQAYCEKPDIILIGNKNDLENRQISSEQAKRLASEFDIPYYETSAKSGENVTEAVTSLLDLVMNRMKNYIKNVGESADGAVTSTNLANSDPSNKNNEEKKSSCAC